MILVIGEALIDLIGEEGSGGNYTAVVGGANANVALALAVRGEQQRFLGRISSDGFGKQIRNHLASHGVDLALSVDAEEQTTLAVATIDSSGVASYSFYTKDTADWGWTPGELPSAEQVAALDAKAIQYGCLGMAIGPGNLVIEAWLKNFFEAGTVTLSHDLNIRPALGFERELELKRVLRLNAQSHIIKASDADIEWLYGLDVGADLDDIASEWSKGKLVVITRGAEGVSLYRDGRRIDVAGQKVNLVDTVGAGDTFMANFLGELSQLDALGGNPSSRLARISDDQLALAATVANAAAAIVCERTGCQPPTLAETRARAQG
ncbi:MAG: PfkB family carbohydrate kinase [Aquiluna sp.]